MLQAVFISDLHLHPDNPAITERFEQFIQWVIEQHPADLYILGDFFHAWAGDDAMDAWSRQIGLKLKSLHDHQIKVYFMPGNRDFLIGDVFLKLSGMQLLSEPALILLDKPVLLAHGDRYCLLDTAHQKFRKLTRNLLFYRLFLALPLSLRLYLVKKIRQKSASSPYNSSKMNVVAEAMLQDMHKFRVHTLIHGHTHRPGLTEYQTDDKIFYQYVLSDWDDIPKLLCYDDSIGLYFKQ